MLNEKLLEILACPARKGDIESTKDNNVLLCHACKLKYRIEDGDIPVMLIDEAEKFKEEQ